MDIGKLRHRVEIQERYQTQDATTGADIISWQCFADVWAAIEPLSVREFIAAQAQQSEVTARITIRYIDGVTSAMRVYHDGKYYVIHGVLADNKSGKEWLTLPVSEGVADE